MAFTSAGIAEPKTGVEGKFSLRFLAALALAEGNVTLDKFTDEKVGDPRINRLRRKVNPTLVRELGFGARLSVRMKDGTEYREFRAKPKGDPANPLSFDELVRKFRSTAGSAIPHENVERLIDRIRTLETLPDVIEIMSLTAP